MLLLTLRPHESLKIGDSVIRIEKSKNSSGFLVMIEAPKEIKIIRESAKNKKPK